jgi:hypothetical protein
VFFRDTAHGLITWAFATVLTAAALGSATSSIVGRVTQSIGGAAAQAGAQIGPIETAVDGLFRADPGAASAAPGPSAGPDPMRAEISRLLSTSLLDGGNLNDIDRTYVARVVAARTGISQADAEKRVAEVIDKAKQTLDDARKAAARLSFWLTASLYRRRCRRRTVARWHLEREKAYSGESLNIGTAGVSHRAGRNLSMGLHPLRGVLTSPACNTERTK